MKQTDLPVLYQLTGANERSYRKGETILYAGSSTEQLGVVLSGSVTVESTDFSGSRTILSRIGTCGVFAETYAFLPDTVLPVDVCASEDCRILFLDLSAFREPEPTPLHLQMLHNLLQVSLHKNLHLSSRSFHTAQKTIRGKVLSYLTGCARQAGTSSFEIPLDRQQLADYLNTDRTALSKELGKMKKEGLITFRKNHFTIITDQRA